MRMVGFVFILLCLFKGEVVVVFIAALEVSRRDGRWSGGHALKLVSGSLKVEKRNESRLGSEWEEERARRHGDKTTRCYTSETIARPRQ